MPGNGEILKHENAVFSGDLSEKVSLVSSDTLVVMDSTGSNLITVGFQDGDINIHNTYITYLVEDSLGSAVLLPSKLSSMFAVKINELTVFAGVTGQGKLKVLYKINGGVAVSDALLFSEDQEAYALVQHIGNDIQFSVKVGHDWHGGLLKKTIKMDYPRGLVHKVFTNKYVRTDRSHGFKALIVMEDHSLLLVQQGVVVWRREKDLASTTDATTSDLSVEKKGVSIVNVEQSPFEWPQGHMLKLKRTSMPSSPEDVAAI